MQIGRIALVVDAEDVKRSPRVPEACCPVRAESIGELARDVSK